MLKWINILWQSFMTAALGELVFFVIIDPQELYLMGEPVRWSPMAVYSVGFFMFWSLTVLTAALVVFMQTPASEVDRRRLQAAPTGAGGPSSAQHTGLP